MPDRLLSWGRYVLALTVAAILTAAHIRVSGHGLDYVGPLLLLDHLFDAFAALILLAVCIGIGHFALVRFKVGFGSAAETLTFGAVVGAGIVATVNLCLGLIGGLQLPTLLAALAAIAVIARREIGSLPQLIARTAREFLEGDSDRRWLFFALSLFALAVTFMAVMAMSPPTDWDAQMYHLQIPTQFLERGRIYLPDDNLHVAYVGLVHMLYLPLLALGSLAGPALLSTCFAALLGVATHSLATRLLGSQAASLTLAILWGTTTILLVAITPRLDVTLALALLLAHLALLASLNFPSERAQFYLAAVLLGMALGIKYHAGLYMLGLAPLVVWTAVSREKAAAPALRSMFAFGALTVAAASPWLLKNWVLLGAPLYPFFAPTALEPWLAPLFASETVPATVGPEAFQVLGYARANFNLMDAFFAPSDITVEFEGAFHYANPALLALPLWVFFLRNKTINWLILPAVVYLLLLIVPFGRINLRYLIPAAVPLTIAVAHMLVKASGRLFSAGAARILLTALVLLALYSSARAAYTWLRYTKSLHYLVGNVSASEYIATHLDPSMRTLASVLPFVTEHVPEDGRVLMLYESRGLYFERRVILDTRVTNWPLLTHVLEGDECLKSSGISHVLLSTGAVRYYIRRGVSPALLRWDEFIDFADQCLGEPIYQGQAFVLFQLS